MLYVGLDVHKRLWVCCVLNGKGEEVGMKWLRPDSNLLVEWLKGFDEPFSVCFEASTGYGYLYERLTVFASEVVVAHPGHLRLVFGSKRKNDRIDARKLARLLLLGVVPKVHVPRPPVRSFRAAVRARQRLVDECTRCKNAIRALLYANGIRAPKSLWSRAGRRWLAAVEFGDRLSAERRDLLVEALEQATARRKRLERILDGLTRHDRAVVLLRTIPGVGIRTAQAMVAYIDEAKRFPRNKFVGSYFGLVPREHTSGGRKRLGHITKNGPAVARRLLNQAAWQAIARSPEVRAFFERVCRDDPKRRKIAIVATMHYLVRVMHAMLRTGEPWRPLAR